MALLLYFDNRDENIREAHKITDHMTSLGHPWCFHTF